MAQIFHPSMNIVAKATIFGAVFILGAVGWAGCVLIRSAYVTGVETVQDQPVPFSHQHHAGDLGLDCRYCHTSVEKSAFAGMPSTEICMGCHSKIWNRSPILEPVRQSARTGIPLSWTRVHDLPDFVYFNHSIHVSKGIGCESCHGHVKEMPLMRKSASLYMEWCVECHRHPELQVREQAEIYEFRSRPRDMSALATLKYQQQIPHKISTSAGAERLLRSAHSAGSETVHPVVSENADRSAEGLRRVKDYGIATKQLTDCVMCHR